MMLTRASRTLAAFLLLALGAGCGHKTPLVVDGHTLNPDPWLKDRQKILERASFDLNCDAAKLELRVMTAGGAWIYNDWASQVGVTGCEQRAVYVRTQSGWVANTTTRAEAK